MIHVVVMTMHMVIYVFLAALFDKGKACAPTGGLGLPRENGYQRTYTFLT